MLVDRNGFDSVLGLLQTHAKLSADTETSGLRPYHGDRLFSIIVTVEVEGEVQSFYFNFLPADDFSSDQILLPSHLARFKELFADPNKKWYLHNAKFDMHMLAQEGIEVAGTIHCTKAVALLEYNEHFKYDLDSCGERIGHKKDDAVDRYITEHKLTSREIKWINADGKPNQETLKHFDKVPAKIMVPYAEQDAKVCYHLGKHQEETLERLVSETRSDLPNLRTVLQNERRLLRTVFRMENRGIRIDRPYCVRAARFEADCVAKARGEFKAHTGKEFSNSPVLFKTVFESEKDKWKWNKPTKTGKINPCFESDVIKHFENPAAKAILDYREHKSKCDFYQGFLYHADRDDRIHPNFNQDGAGHGRFSSSNPNFQNLTSEDSEEELDQEFVVRRAIIPADGTFLFMPDYSACEYRMLYDVACDLLGRESEIVKKINAGFDPHQATADVVTAMGVPLTRKKAKNGNFAYLYGSGHDTLAATIGSTRADAIALKTAMKRAAPEVDNFVNQIIHVARTRGYIFNWFGRRCYFPDPNFAYRAPNYYISGGCADVVKIAMNKIDEYLLDKKSKMIMMVHDELVFEIVPEEADEVTKQIVEFMEGVYPFKYLPLICSSEWSEKSLADTEKYEFCKSPGVPT